MDEPSREYIFKTARDVLSTLLPDAWAIYVFGSFARGDERPDSDLDLAVLLPPKAIIPDKLDVIAEVSRRVGREADLVNLREAGLDLTHELLRDGIQLLVRHPGDVLGWEAEQMSDYADLNPRRAGILASYLQEPVRG
jgi:predicted nucleotidyltransferase